MKTDQLLIEIIQNGLPLVSHPYATIGEQIGLTETEVIARLNDLIETGIIKRFGIVVYHRKLGYRANAMVVWDISDTEVDLIGEKLGQFKFVTLCYRRSRHLPDWPYNLYCMIHGTDREIVLQKLDKLVKQCEMERFSHQVLFSKHCFKQRGAIYYPTSNSNK
ncbi:MAG: hypothetical protein KAG43_10640 [Candidatus Marithrix sp.]|nr:hypothetical protein [Candidatus Marithrix sp.]